jgi:hypothetical protein
MNKRLLLLLSFFALIGAQLLTPLQAIAADSKPLNLVTSPLPINLSTDPGTTVSTDLRIKQAGGDTERLKVSLMKFAAYGDEGKPKLVDRGPGDSYFDWVKFDKTQFDAPSNVWQTIHMTINVPKDAAFGYYYAVVFSREGDDVRQAGNTNSINGGTAVLVLLDAKVANAKRSLELNSFTSEHRLYEFLPANFKVSFKNTGNVHIVPTGNIFISKGKTQIATLSINAEMGNILPQSNRIYDSSWGDGYPHNEPVIEAGKTKLDANNQQVNHLVWSNGEGNDMTPHLRMGEYTAHLFAVYDDGTRDVPIESEITFWVVPWRFLLALLAVALLIGFGIFGLVRGTWSGARKLSRKK